MKSYAKLYLSFLVMTLITAVVVSPLAKKYNIPLLSRI